MLRTYRFPVDVSCGACTPHVEKLIRGTGLNIEKINTNIVSKLTTVEVNIESSTHAHPEEIIKTALRDGGRLIEEPEENQLAATPTTISRWQRWLKGETPPWLKWLLGGIGVISGIAILSLMIAGISLSFPIMLALGIASSILSLALGLPTIIRATKNLFQSGALNMDTLYALGGVSAILITIAHFLIPGIPMMFDAALLIFGFKHIGDAIKERATRPNERDIQFSDRTKFTVTTEPTGEEIDIDSIPVGTIIRVARNSIIPIDGIILDDDVYLYETLLNGYGDVKHYTKNDEVLSGYRIASDNDNSFIRIKTTRSSQDSNLNQLDKRLSIEKQQKPKIIAASENLLRWFIPVAIAVAVISAAILTAVFLPALGLAGAVTIGLKCLIGVLVSACPCTLGLAAPLAENAGLNKAKNQHISFKNNESLQTASQTNVILFDLNGTLTMGKPIVTSFYSTKDHDKTLSAALALESRSNHSFAKAIQHFASSALKAKTPLSATKPKVDRSGVSGIIDENRVIIGNASMMQKNKLDTEVYLRNHNISMSEIQQIIYIAQNDEIIGHFILEDPIRHGAKQTVKRLQKMGYEVSICTGASEETAQAYARQFNIERVYADCKNIAKKTDDSTIMTKFDVVKKIQNEGKIVAMIGDAGNDAIPIAASHFGVAIKSECSDDITLNVADAMIDHDSLLSVVALFEIATQTTNNIKQNILASLSFNSLTVAAAIAGTALTALGFIFPPAIGAGLMVLLLVPIFINVKRLEKQELTQFEKANYQANENEDLYSSAGLRKKMPLGDRPKTAPLADARGSDYPALRENVETRELVSGVGEESEVVNMDMDDQHEVRLKDENRKHATSPTLSGVTD